MNGSSALSNVESKYSLSNVISNIPGAPVTSTSNNIDIKSRSAETVFIVTPSASKSIL